MANPWLVISGYPLNSYITIPDVFVLVDKAFSCPEIINTTCLAPPVATDAIIPLIAVKIDSSV
jgi:hypothetical protein